MPYLTTKSRRKIELTNLRAEDFTIEDIAFALAGERRYAANLPLRVNVATHSIIVSRLVTPDLRLPALLHDAAEMLTGDIPAPVKRLIASDELFLLVRRIDIAIAARFGIDADAFHSAAIKAADRKGWRFEMVAAYGPEVLKDDDRLRAVEWTEEDEALSKSFPVVQSDVEAERAFLDRFDEILRTPTKAIEAIARPC